MTNNKTKIVLTSEERLSGKDSLSLETMAYNSAFNNIGEKTRQALTYPVPEARRRSTQPIKVGFQNSLDGHNITQHTDSPRAFMRVNQSSKARPHPASRIAVMPKGHCSSKDSNSTISQRRIPTPDSWVGEESDYYAQTEQIAARSDHPEAVVDACEEVLLQRGNIDDELKWACGFLSKPERVRMVWEQSSIAPANLYGHFSKAGESKLPPVRASINAFGQTTDKVGPQNLKSDSSQMTVNRPPLKDITTTCQISRSSPRKSTKNLESISDCNVIDLTEATPSPATQCQQWIPLNLPLRQRFELGTRLFLHDSILKGDFSLTVPTI